MSDRGAVTKRAGRSGLADLRRVLFLAAACSALAACATAPEREAANLGTPEADGPVLARIVEPERPLQCVPYARQHSRIKIRGDARTWWRQAEGRYLRSRRPSVGAVMVLKPVRASRGHVAVVRRILNQREIVVDHANWLNRGRIHEGTPVRDVSPGNDWSVVRVWYTPGRRYGAGRYPVEGFIEPPVTTAAR